MMPLDLAQAAHCFVEVIQGPPPLVEVIIGTAGPPGPPGMGSITVAETAPLGAAEGDLWWDSSVGGGQLYVYYTDVDSSAWIIANTGGGGGPVGDQMIDCGAF